MPGDNKKALLQAPAHIILKKKKKLHMDEEEHVIEDFYGVYMLYSTNPKYLGRTYIGYTVNPNRRVNQHNKGSQFGGARRTSNKGPWEMVLIVHGFPNDVAALRFEWAWQHPHRSRRLANVTRTKTNRRTLDFCLRIMSEMLNVGPWNRLPLTLRWLKPAFQRDLPVSLPNHMSILQGPLVTKRLKTGETQQMPSDSGSSRCGLCRKDLPEYLALSCIACEHRCHAICLANHFLRFSSTSHIIPIEGQCPKCNASCLWGDIVRKKKGVTI